MNAAQFLRNLIAAVPFHYDDHAQLKKHLADFIDAYNFGRTLCANRANHGLLRSPD